MSAGWRRSAWAATLTAVLLALHIQTASPTPAQERPTPAEPLREGIPAEAPPAAFVPEPALPVPNGWPYPDAFPRTSGTGRRVAGSLQWSDFIYDDFGPTGPDDGSVFGLTGTRGGYIYPDGEPYNGNAADLFRVGIGLDEAATYWRVDWTTLIDPDVPIAAFGIDTDGADAGLFEEWSSVPHLFARGVDTELLLSSRDAWVVDTASGSRTPVSEIGGVVTVDPDARSFVVKVPHSALEPSGMWTANVVSGLANPVGDGFSPVPPERGGLPLHPPVYNAAFRTQADEDPYLNHWMEVGQATALTLRDISAFKVELDWEDLSSGVTDRSPRPTGYQNRWYVSSLDLGQGVLPNGESGAFGDYQPNVLGRIQPYALYVPTSYDGSSPVGLRWLLHALHTNHNIYGTTAPKFIQQTCEAWDAICVMPMGRGPDLWYENEAELEIWEIWNRLAADYRLDPESTSIAGYSMGGHGTSRMVHRYPDLFARGAVLAGPVGDVPELTNLRWVPMLITHGVPDVGALAQAEEMAAALDRHGYRYRYDLYATEDHITYALKDGFSTAANWLADHRRTTDPARISMVWSTETDRRDLGFAVTGAYWVRDVVVRDSDPPEEPRTGPESVSEPRWAIFEAISHARPDPEVHARRDMSVDVPGDPAPALVRTLDWQLGEIPQSEPLIEIDLTNVTAFSLHTARAGLAPRQAATVVVQSDGPVDVTLTELAPGSVITIDDARVATANRVGAAVVRAAGGETLIEVALISDMPLGEVEEPASHTVKDASASVAADHAGQRSALDPQVPAALGAADQSSAPSLPATGASSQAAAGAALILAGLLAARALNRNHLGR